MEELKQILMKEIPGVDFDKMDLVESGALDSMAIMTILTIIEEKYSIEVDPLDIIPDNFNSLEAIWKLVQ